MPMNYHSEIIKFIIKHLGEITTIDEIIGLMKSINVNCRIQDTRIIFNYGIAADFSNPVVQEARGIIFNMNTTGSKMDMSEWTVVAWPFRKFGNHHESYADKINWDTAQIQEKIDGSIIKLYRFNRQWCWATNGCIEASNAPTSVTGHTFMDIIESADNYRNIDYNILDKHKTYIFELVSPETRVVVDYPIAHLYHLGTRSNLTGIEFNTDIGIEKPRVYNIDDPNLEKVIEAAQQFDDNNCEHEGFVVCDSDFHRIKVKNLTYLKLHHSLTARSLNKEDVIEAIIYNDEEYIETILECPHLIVDFKYYDWQVAKLLRDLDVYVKMARSLYASLNENRKDFALKIKNDKFATFGFQAIDHFNLDAMQMIKTLGVKRVSRFISTCE